MPLGLQKHGHKVIIIMMTTEQVLAYAQNLHANDVAEPETTPANVDDGKAQEVETVEASQESTPTGSEKVEELQNTAPEVTETKPVDEPKDKTIEDKKPSEKNDKRQYTKQEKIDYAFQKEKAKQKKLEARIRELEAQLAEKNNLTIEDFDNKVGDYVNYAVDRKDKEREKAQIEEALSESRRAEYDAINQRKIDFCFPDENEKAIYNKLLADHGQEFLKTLDDNDPQEAVLGFLDDSDVAPILVRILMTSKTHRDQVLSKHSPYAKQRAMEALENSVKFAMAKLAKQKNTVPEKNEETKPVKPVMPIVGSVTKTEKGSGNEVKDYNDILHKLNNRNKYNSTLS